MLLPLGKEIKVWSSLLPGHHSALGETCPAFSHSISYTNASVFLIVSNLHKFLPLERGKDCLTGIARSVLGENCAQKIVQLLHGKELDRVGSFFIL